MEIRVDEKNTGTVKNLEIERSTHEMFEKLCKHLGVNTYTLGNFMLVKGIMSFLDGTENKAVFSDDELLHVTGMDSVLETSLVDEMRRSTLKKMLEVLNKE